MSQLSAKPCTACDKVKILEQPDDDAHPCFKHSKELCVTKLDNARGWNPSECLMCINMVNRALSGTGVVQSNAQKNLNILTTGVTSFANRVSSSSLARVFLSLSQTRAILLS